jgi:hypothetical protein
MTDLAVVREIKSDSEGSTVRLSDGTERRLATANREYRRWLGYLEESLGQGQPVSLTPDDVGRIGQVHQADNDTVEEVVVDPQGGARVFFQGHNGIFSLSQDLLGYTRVLGVLRTSAQTRSPVWFVADRALALQDAALAKSPGGETKAAPPVRSVPNPGTLPAPGPSSDVAADSPRL